MEKVTEKTFENELVEKEIEAVFQKQKLFAPTLALTSAGVRIAKLRKISNYIDAHQQELEAVLYLDMKKPALEAILSESLNVQVEIEFIIKKLKRWMKPEKVSNPIMLFGTSSYIKKEPKGTVLIISPWNYPFNLAIKPLVSAIAAGNTAFVKPSEITPNTSAFIKSMISSLFDEQEVAVFEGNKNVSEALLQIPFNHIFFTGSPVVGKLVMKAAARNLSSVTLELGGKSPCIIDETVDVDETAKKLVWGKWFNNGQTCIAPDYVLVHASIKDQLIAKMIEYIKVMYGEDVSKSASYARIVNEQHFSRLKFYLDDAVTKGAFIDFGGQLNESDLFVSPTIISHVKDDMKIMYEEVFGPLLPVMEFDNKEEVIDYIRRHEKPLALYINSKKKDHVDYFLNNTTAGGTVVNDFLIHYNHPGLPFGGVNNSGIGKSFGKYGFDEFSNLRGIIKQKWNLTTILYPPYNENWVKKIRWFSRFLK